MNKKIFHLEADYRVYEVKSADEKDVIFTVYPHDNPWGPGEDIKALNKIGRVGAYDKVLIQHQGDTDLGIPRFPVAVQLVSKGDVKRKNLEKRRHNRLKQIAS